MSNKKCTICKVAKPSKMFYRFSMYSTKGKEWKCRDSMCKQCRSNYSVKRRQVIKIQVIEYLGGKCCDCGLVDNPIVYDCHHLDPTKKEFSFGKVSKNFENLKLELKKCVLLCANCHRKRHI